MHENRGERWWTTICFKKKIRTTLQKNGKKRTEVTNFLKYDQLIPYRIGIKGLLF